MIKWNSKFKTLEFGPRWYIQFNSLIKGYTQLGISLTRHDYCTCVNINIFKLSLEIGRGFEA